MDYGNNRKHWHTVLKVELRDGRERHGEIFAVDLAGAQYGHPEPVLPWKEYEDNRALQNGLVTPVSSTLFAYPLLHYTQEWIARYRLINHVGIRLYSQTQRQFL